MYIFKRTLPTWADCCPPYPVPLHTVIFATQSDSIKASGNCIVSRGKYAKTFLNITSTATVTGQSKASWSSCK